MPVNKLKTSNPQCGDGPSFIPAQDVPPEPVRWWWYPRLPCGKLTLLDGDPSAGKTLVALDLAARISAGLPMPLSQQRPEWGARDVLIASLEDGLGDTLRPRLEAAGADLERVHFLQPEHLLSLPDDVGGLKLEIRHHNAALVVIDPVMAAIKSMTYQAVLRHSVRSLRWPNPPTRRYSGCGT